MRRAVCCILVCLFTAGYLPARGGGCRCNAERNCGCYCWLESAAASRAADHQGVALAPCCALGKDRRQSACRATLDSERRPVSSLPESGQHRHGPGLPMDWLAVEPPEAAVPEVSRPTGEAPAVVARDVPSQPRVPPP